VRQLDAWCNHASLQEGELKARDRWATPTRKQPVTSALHATLSDQGNARAQMGPGLNLRTRPHPDRGERRPFGMGTGCAARDDLSGFGCPTSGYGPHVPLGPKQVYPLFSTILGPSSNGQSPGLLSVLSQRCEIICLDSFRKFADTRPVWRPGVMGNAEHRSCFLPRRRRHCPCPRLAWRSVSQGTTQMTRPDRTLERVGVRPSPARGRLAPRRGLRAESQP